MDIRKECLKLSIKCNRKSSRMQLGILTFNIIGVIWGSYWIYFSNKNSSFFYLSLGILITTILFQIINLLEAISSYHMDKEQLKYIEQYEINKEFQHDKDTLKDLIKYYQDITIKSEKINNQTR